ncbi:MAG TPA: NAD(P)/FAD-dependent oxidoreductase [Armatimonadota bacterium]|nr:NAD(P)/FAD-dependent oxidoreductase [Armatimonadota bacterium]
MRHEQTKDEGKTSDHPRVIILGAGFGGFYCVRYLVKQLAHLHRAVDVTLIDRNNYFFFIPLLHEAMVQRVAMHHIVHPIRQSLRRMPVTFCETTVKSIDLAAQVVHTEDGALPYDYLVLALGSTTNYYQNQQFARYGFPMKSPDDAYRLRNHVIRMFSLAAETADTDRRRQLLTFLMVGAGYTGQETITELHDFIHASLLRDYPQIQPAEIRLLMVDGHPDLPVPPHRGLARRALRVLQRRGIEIRFHTRVKDAGAEWVELADGERINTCTMIWTAGVQANPIVADLPVAKGSLGRLQVLPTLQLPGYPQVFVLGDCTYFQPDDHPALPPTAQVANQQAATAADNLTCLLTGRVLSPFIYHQKVELATLGPYHGVAEIGPLRFHGFLAWLAINVIYLYILPCWRERARIAADWWINLFYPPDTSCISAESSSALSTAQKNDGQTQKET